MLLSTSPGFRLILGVCESYHVCGELSLVIALSNDQTLAGIGGEDDSGLAEGGVFVVAVSDLGGREVEVAELLGSDDDLLKKKI